MARLQTELHKNPAAHLVGSFDPSRSCSRCRELLDSTESEGHKFHLHAPPPPPGCCLKRQNIGARMAQNFEIHSVGNSLTQP